MSPPQQILLSAAPSQHSIHQGSVPHHAAAHRGFANVFRHLGFATSDLARPQNYFAPAARSGIAANAVHVRFGPPEALRLLRGARNIAYFAGDGEHLTVPHGFPRLPFDDIRRMLILPDEVWAGSVSACDRLRDCGAPRAYHIPVPITLPGKPASLSDIAASQALDAVRWTRLRIGYGRYRHIKPLPADDRSLREIIDSRYQGARPQIFVAAADETTSSAELNALITGFLEFRCEQPNALLLVTVTGNSPETGAGAVSAFLRQRPFGFEFADSDGVWFTAASLSSTARTGLHAAASAYICPCSTMAQDRLLLEAMAYGVAAVAPASLATADYVTTATAVIIDGKAGCSAPALANALREFCRLPPAAQRDMGSRAGAVIADALSVDRIAGLVADRLRRLPG